MISIEESRKILGKLGKKLSDEQVEKLRNDLYRMVSIILDDYYERKDDDTARKNQRANTGL